MQIVDEARGLKWNNLVCQIEESIGPLVCWTNQSMIRNSTGIVNRSGPNKRKVPKRL